MKAATHPHTTGRAGRTPWRTIGLCLVALLAASCAQLRSATAPMYVVSDPSRCAVRADTLVVMLPGIYSNPDEFTREGFVHAVQEQRLAVDVLRVDAHLGYYEKGTFVDRLRQDVIAPAQARGYRAIWIVGISLGGFGGLIYAQDRPGELAGLVALAPYLGEPGLDEAVQEAGGLRRWTPPTRTSQDLRAQRETALWTGLKSYAAPSDAALSALWLGYGTADRFASANSLLGAVLPADRVFTTEGGHDWAPWRRLWESMLRTLPLPRCAS
jgi:pimeloyl-ACP methyl ester carboxylesterase